MSRIKSPDLHIYYTVCSGAVIKKSITFYNNKMNCSTVMHCSIHVVVPRALWHIDNLFLNSFICDSRRTMHDLFLHYLAGRPRTDRVTDHH